MPNWNDLLNEIRADSAESAHYRVRRKHLAKPKPELPKLVN